MKKTLILWVLALMVTIPASAQVLNNIDEIAPFSEGLAAVRKGKQWGFINEEGKMVIEYRDDIFASAKVDETKTDVSGVKYPIFSEGLCIIKSTVEDGVPVFGFMDTSGKIVIEPQFLNVFPFKDGFTTAVLFDKSFKGENEFKLKIFEYKFFDVRVSSTGEITDYFEKRDHVQMTVKRYQMPEIGAKIIHKNLVATHKAGQGWTIENLETKK
ncbi:WG repeat-containing protein [Maribacter sp. 1_MG-2023]|uniref:WG repeat-containing protein n=1 Tax=Maribacter sp. 1_MG-2023 TaxID=3062677 RepID=UPI0026E178BD|nr:WG repeat-containing protein [Maribacter sp. 1_MG-2023]MDO6472549.1 WG repeat-containing protein [Maribacter sp. 1_MG-2023]